MSVIKNTRTKSKVANTMQTQGAPLTENDVGSRLLPDVSTADAGAFLAVDENGEWGLDTPEGGGLYVINTVGPPTPVGIDKTFDEIKEAYLSGMVPVIKSTNGPNYIYELTNATTTGQYANQRFVFRHYEIGTGASIDEGLIVYEIVITSSDAFTYTVDTLETTFSATQVATRSKWVDGKTVYRRTVTHAIASIETFSDIPANSNLIRADVVYTKAFTGTATSLNYSADSSTIDFAYAYNVAAGTVTYDPKGYEVNIVATFYYTLS